MCSIDIETHTKHAQYELHCFNFLDDSRSQIYIYWMTGKFRYLEI